MHPLQPHKLTLLINSFPLQLLSYIGYTSPEVLEQFGHALNEAVGPPLTLPIEAQHDAISSILNQRNVESEFFTRHSIDPK